MQDVEKVEELEEEVVDDIEGGGHVADDQEEVDPEEQLTEVLSQKAELEAVELKMLAQKEIIEREEAELHHALAVGLVDGLFTELQGFAGEFTSGVIYGRYQGIQAHIEKIREHDGAFPKSLSEGRYSVDMAGEDYNFWLNCLEKYVATGESLEKFLRGVFGTRTHGTPFESGD